MPRTIKRDVRYEPIDFSRILKALRKKESFSEFTRQASLKEVELREVNKKINGS